jgi:hypothetical protein
MSVGIDLGPLRDAVAVMREKVPVGSAMGSREWGEVQAEIRLRAMFSARVESERLLVEMQRRLLVRMELGRKDGRTMDRGVFIEEMREELRQAGYRRGEARRDGLQDLKSTRRLGLIWDMNVAMAQGYARRLADMRPEDLAAEPCYELVRDETRVELRRWPSIWADRGGQFFDGPGSNDDYPESPGRMIARKTDEIWIRISRFGVPWPPFDWGSGMGLRGISREEADAFGITDPDEELTPVPLPFTTGAAASVRLIPEEGRARLVEEMAGDVEIVGDEIRILPPPPPPPPVVVFPPPVRRAMTTAGSTLAQWPEAKVLRLVVLLDRTVAWTRYRAGLRDAKPQDTIQALQRALVQFSGTAEAKAAIAELRQTDLRDAFWSAADFAILAEYLAAEVAR